MLKKFRRSEDGSLTLEAAMVMPFFLLFVVFLATVIRISVADMALRNAVNDTAEIVATHVYPAALAERAARSKLDDQVKAYTQGELDLNKASELVSGILDEFGINLMGHVNSIAGNALTPVVQSKFEQSTEDGFFKKDRLSVKVEAPSSFLSGQYIGIIGTYEIGITAPFVNKKITLQKKAYERLWSGA